MDFVKKGDIVEIDYTIKYSNGMIYDSTSGKRPVQFEIGSDIVFPGIEQAIIGMAIGDNKLVTVKSADMFQNPKDELITDVPISDVPEHVNKRVGQRVRIDQDKLPPLIAIITEVTETHLTLDANLPMAGKDFLLSLSLIDIIRYEG